ncbi:hypothetical protein G9A89_022305 [Geosiphon pyriformis]|nr:hypothetical protein G9A89_022305 [Geosiphon pyriformis]
MEPGFNIRVKSAESRKKKRGGALEDNIDNKKFAAAKVLSGHFWSSETGNTTESDSVDMEEKCLVEETSFDYEDDRAFTKGDLKQMPKSSKILIKRALKKPLGKINFLGNNSNNILLNTPLTLPPFLKTLVDILVRKLFALDIGLNKMYRKSFQKKLSVVKKLFSGINGFGGASTPSKFSGIIHATFTSELGLMKATEKATSTKILVNTDFKKSTKCSNQTVVLKKIPVGMSAKAVCVALSEYGVVVLIKMQLVGLWQKAIVKFGEIEQTDLVAAYWSILIKKDAVYMVRANKDKELWDVKDHHRALLYTLPMRTNAHNIWDFIGSIGEKTCVINHHPITYAWARCAVICFNSAEFLDTAMNTTLVLRDMNLHWSCLGFSKCAKCGKIKHMSLGCSVSKNLSSGRSSYRTLLDIDKSRLATIYAKCSALIACPVTFEIKPTLPVMIDIEKRFAVLESSLTSLMKQISELVKKLDLLVPAVFQPSPECQLPVTPLLQD